MLLLQAHLFEVEKGLLCTKILHVDTYNDKQRHWRIETHSFSQNSSNLCLSPLSAMYFVAGTGICSKTTLHAFSKRLENYLSTNYKKDKHTQYACSCTSARKSLLETVFR